MKPYYVRDLQPNQLIVTTFLVHNKEIRQKRSGESYLSLHLADRTGELDAKMWDNVAEVIETFDRDDFVKVKGLVQIYQNRPQLTIHKMIRVPDSAVDFGDYFPCSDRDRDEMFAELCGIVGGIGNPHLRALLELFLTDAEVARSYRTAPAAKSVHHAYLGGLLEHVLSLCALSRMSAAHYRDVDCDLLLAGVVLHDIGKIAELTYERTFGYSSDGQLLGHIVIGMKMLQDKIAQVPGFPPRLRTLLEHMILSHHGELEFGSPKVPLFLEALLLHHLDNMDSKMECMRAAIARDRNVDGCWTSYTAPLERTVLKKSIYLNGPAAPVAAPAPAPAPAAAPVPAPVQAHPVEPKPEPVPAAPAAPQHEKHLSSFASKLQEVWHKQ